MNNIDTTIEEYKADLANFIYYVESNSYSISNIDDVVNLVNSNDEMKDQFEIYFNTSINEFLTNVNHIVKVSRIDMAKLLNDHITSFNRDFESIKEDQNAFGRIVVRNEEDEERKNRLEEDLNKKFNAFNTKYNLY